MFCTECGQQIADDAKFCAYCGTRRSVPAVARETSVPAVQPAPPEPPRAVAPPASPVRSTADVTPIRTPRPGPPPPAQHVHQEPPQQEDSVVRWPAKEEAPPLFTPPQPVPSSQPEPYRAVAPVQREVARPAESAAQPRYRSVTFAAEPGTPESVEGRRKISPVLIGAIVVAVIAIAGIVWMVQSSMLGAGKSNAPIAVTVYPTAAKVAAGKSLDLKADVTGAANSGVTWTVEEGDAGGSVRLQSASTAEENSLYCTYTAPKTPGTYHVVATSNADKSKSGTGEVTVTPEGKSH